MVSSLSSEAGEQLLQSGDFSGAKAAFLAALVHSEQDYRVFRGLGYLALLGNQLADAEVSLRKAYDLYPRDQHTPALLAEVFTRNGNAQLAAEWWERAGFSSLARQWRSLRDVTPFQIEGQVQETRLPFVVHDPLPVVKARVNNSDEVDFLIDTGGTLHLDLAFAKEVQANFFRSSFFRPDRGTFAGGRQAKIISGSIEQLVLNELSVRHLPVKILDLRAISQQVFAGRRICGVIGSTLLFHFLATLNYTDRELILRRKTQEQLAPFEHKAVNGQLHSLPIWLADDHYVVTEGTINKSQPLLWFVDTGVAGAAVTCSERTLQDARISLLNDSAQTGMGVGGAVRVVPFQVDTLTLGDVQAEQVPGLFIGNFTEVEQACGFRIGGMLAHQFFEDSALTFDFTGMRLFLNKVPGLR